VPFDNPHQAPYRDGSPTCRRRIPTVGRYGRAIGYSAWLISVAPHRTPWQRGLGEGQTVTTLRSGHRKRSQRAARREPGSISRMGHIYDECILRGIKKRQVRGAEQLAMFERRTLLQAATAAA
jgi:hypothetical protein